MRPRPRARERDRGGCKAPHTDVNSHTHARRTRLLFVLSSSENTGRLNATWTGPVHRRKRLRLSHIEQRCVHRPLTRAHTQTLPSVRRGSPFSSSLTVRNSSSLCPPRRGQPRQRSSAVRGSAPPPYTHERVRHTLQTPGCQELPCRAPFFLGVHVPKWGVRRANPGPHEDGASLRSKNGMMLRSTICTRSIS